MRKGDALVIIIIILISSILVGLTYQIQNPPEIRKDFVMIGEFAGCGIWEISFLNNGTILDNGYVFRITNITFIEPYPSYMSSQTEFWFSSLGPYTIDFLNGYINETLKVYYHINSKDKIAVDSIIDLVEVWK